MQFSTRLLTAISLAATAGALLTACGGDESRPVVSNGVAPPECASRPGGSRWASAASTYHEAGAYGRDEQEHWISDIAGVAAFDSLVFVYDAGRARVVALREDLSPVRVFGREGRGPGEFQPERDMGWRGRGWRWLDVADRQVAVFDGTRIQFFGPDGTGQAERFKDPLREGAITFETDRLRFWDGAVVAGSGGYRAGWKKDPPNRWTLYRSTERRADAILSLDLSPRPKTARGVPFTGPEQAIPVWDMANGCVLAGDGTGRWVVRSNVAGSAVDTLALDLPDLGRPKVDVEQLERLMGMSGRGRAGGYVRPSALREIELITVDPDGYAWILPVQDSAAGGEGVEVVRLSLQTGATERDTVPAFPVAFGAPGVFYARSGNRDDPVVVRYRKAAPAAGESPR